MLIKIISIVAAVSIAAFLRFTTHFDFVDRLQGFYLLKGQPGYLLELKDDIMLGEYERLLCKLDLGFLRDRPLSHSASHQRTSPYLTYQWDPDGHGYFITFFPDGTKLLSCFGRFVDDLDRKVHGLFVGGGLPPHYYEDSEVIANATGMAFFDGREWHHLWCNANETLFAAAEPQTGLLPGSWHYLGSKVLLGTEQDLVIQSTHLVPIDGIPVRIDRFMAYHAGDRYFFLINRLTNVGTTPTMYHYVYGDEPWVGDFGTSAGNVGWTRDRLYQYEAHVAPQENSFIGMFDNGNPAAGEKVGQYVGIADFIDWKNGIPPSSVYFSNRFGSVAPESARVPLAAKDMRVMALNWYFRTLMPGQSEQMVLAIGMANTTPGAPLPTEPQVTMAPEGLKAIPAR